MPSVTDQPTTLRTFSEGTNNKLRSTGPEPGFLQPEVAANDVVAAQAIQFDLFSCH